VVHIMGSLPCEKQGRQGEGINETRRRFMKK
jgi:hypothetical protein